MPIITTGSPRDQDVSVRLANPHESSGALRLFLVSRLAGFDPMTHIWAGLHLATTPAVMDRCLRLNAFVVLWFPLSAYSRSVAPADRNAARFCQNDSDNSVKYCDLISDMINASLSVDLRSSSLFSPFCCYSLSPLFPSTLTFSEFLRRLRELQTLSTDFNHTQLAGCAWSREEPVIFWHL